MNQPQPIQPSTPQGGERAQDTPEQASSPVTPEQAPVINSPEADPGTGAEKPAGEAFQDQQTQAPVAPQAPVTDDVDLAPTEPTPEEAEETTSTDKTYMKATKQVIESFEDKPYEEEEAHEDLQIRYLWQRFKKKLSKSKD